MSTINTVANTAINAALLADFGAALGQAFRFGTMNISLGSFLGGIFQPAAPSFTATMPQNGRATVDLGDGYTLALDEANSQMIIRDASGNETKIWGDPHVDVNGQRVGDFWGTTTFELKNGTKLTINTEQWNGNPNAYVASQVVVTRGDQALVIDGLSQNQLGDLSISLGGSGYALDAAHADGLVVGERADGKGWISSLTGQGVTQTDFDTTKPGRTPPVTFSPELGAALGLWLFAASLAPVLSFAGLEAGEATGATSIRNPFASLQTDLA